jgi:N-acetylneuraminic acid mutarotase
MLHHDTNQCPSTRSEGHLFFGANTAARSWIFAVLMMGPPVSRAQVPQLIHFQGRVAVNGTPFNSTGLFKFALVNGDGSTTYWSNDGTSTVGSQPSAAVSLSVSRGLYSVLLGDTMVANMTQPIGPTIFTNSDVRLRVWFNDGTTGYQQLSPDQRIAAVGYALVAQTANTANTVADGAITAAKLAPSAVTADSIAPRAIASNRIASSSIWPTHLTPGAALINLNASGQSGVPSGGIILSAVENSALASAGYVRIGTTQLADNWQQRVAGTPLGARTSHTAVWTGSEMIVWGGSGAGALSDGARYNPAANSWTALPPTGAPGGRYCHTAVWTGTEMVIWGGWDGTTCLSDGGRYNPAANLWTTLPAIGVPTARYCHTAVWTGSDMIVWGGCNTTTGALNDGARYNPAGNVWIPVPTTDAPGARWVHTAVWTGSEMIVWGGYGGGMSGLDDGARYNPAANTWATLPSAGAPSTRYLHTAVWTGSDMIV